MNDKTVPEKAIAWAIKQSESAAEPPPEDTRDFSEDVKKEILEKKKLWDAEMAKMPWKSADWIVEDLDVPLVEIHDHYYKGNEWRFVNKYSYKASNDFPPVGTPGFRTNEMQAVATFGGILVGILLIVFIFYVIKDPAIFLDLDSIKMVIGTILQVGAACGIIAAILIWFPLRDYRRDKKTYKYQNSTFFEIYSSRR